MRQSRLPQARRGLSRGRVAPGRAGRDAPPTQCGACASRGRRRCRHFCRGGGGSKRCRGRATIPSTAAANAAAAATVADAAICCSRRGGGGAPRGTRGRGCCSRLALGRAAGRWGGRRCRLHVRTAPKEPLWRPRRRRRRLLPHVLHGGSDRRRSLRRRPRRRGGSGGGCSGGGGCRRGDGGGDSGGSGGGHCIQGPGLAPLERPPPCRERVPAARLESSRRRRCARRFAHCCRCLHRRRCRCHFGKAGGRSGGGGNRCRFFEGSGGRVGGGGGGGRHVHPLRGGARGSAAGGCSLRGPSR